MQKKYLALAWLIVFSAFVAGCGGGGGGGSGGKSNSDSIPRFISELAGTQIAFTVTDSMMPSSPVGTEWRYFYHTDGSAQGVVDKGLYSLNERPQAAFADTFRARRSGNNIEITLAYSREATFAGLTDSSGTEVFTLTPGRSASEGRYHYKAVYSGDQLCCSGEHSGTYRTLPGNNIRFWSPDDSVPYSRRDNRADGAVLLSRMLLAGPVEQVMMDSRLGFYSAIRPDGTMILDGTRSEYRKMIDGGGGTVQPIPSTPLQPSGFSSMQSGEETGRSSSATMASPFLSPPAGTFTELRFAGAASALAVTSSGSVWHWGGESISRPNQRVLATPFPVKTLIPDGFSTRLGWLTLLENGVLGIVCELDCDPNDKKVEDSLVGLGAGIVSAATRSNAVIYVGPDWAVHTAELNASLGDYPLPIIPSGLPSMRDVAVLDISGPPSESTVVFAVTRSDELMAWGWDGSAVVLPESVRGDVFRVESIRAGIRNYLLVFKRDGAVQALQTSSNGVIDLGRPEQAQGARKVGRVGGLFAFTH